MGCDICLIFVNTSVFDFWCSWWLNLHFLDFCHFFPIFKLLLTLFYPLLTWKRLFFASINAGFTEHFWTQWLHDLVFQMGQVTRFKCIPPQEAHWVGSLCALHLLLLYPPSRYTPCFPLKFPLNTDFLWVELFQMTVSFFLETLAHKATIKDTGKKN